MKLQLGVVASLLMSGSLVNAGSFFDTFIDPKDGRFDTSEYLIDNSGFLPMPIVITEPALGAGGGVAAVFFHESEDEKQAARARMNTSKGRPGDDDMLTLPPSVSVLLGAATSNGTWLAGGAHLGNWKQDHIRYTGALLRASLNLTFYDTGTNTDGGSGLDFNGDGWYFMQEAKFRLPGSNWFLGGRLDLMDLDIKFDDGDNAPGVPSDNTNNNSNVGLGAVATYDTRDNLFSPNRGVIADFEAMFFEGENFGDYTYQKYEASSHMYWDNLLSNVVLGWRLDGKFANGDTPFYSLPYIDLRGIAAMRYQGEDVILTEVEARWNFRNRWSLIGFAGIGSAEDSFSNLFDSEESTPKKTIGTGFRYLMARRLGLQGGIDVARGPDETAVYFTVGSAWR